MKKGDYLTTILRSKKTVFSLTDISILWREPISNAMRVRLNYYVAHGDLHRIRQGIYAKDNRYDPLELATRVYTPAYVSFETVLAREGMIFQFQREISVASYLSRDIVINGQSYRYHKLADFLLAQPLGISLAHETAIASKERAFLDMLYLRPTMYFDSIRDLDWESIHSMVKIYDNARLQRTVARLFSQSQKGTTL